MVCGRRFFVGRNKQNILTILYICVITAVLYYRFIVAEFDATTLRKYIIENHSHNVDDKLSRHRSENIKYVLFWTKFWNLPSWYLGGEVTDEKMLRSIDCPVTNCIFTHSKTFLSSVKDYDAIVFHGAEYLNSQVPAERDISQLYVLANLESPFLTKEDLARFLNFYNLTMTYRFDSDIHWSYGKIIDKLTKNIVAPSAHVKWREPQDDYFDETIYEMILNKKKSATWFVSNCNSYSNREKLSNELKTFINTEIYGKCGTMTCKKYSSRCTDLLDTRYMFYFAFENALCKDYVTEKFYMPLTKYVIPIVFNGADSSLFAPPKSYIDVNDFESVDELAQYLNFLMDNPREYIKYFWWKKHYKVMLNLPSFQTGFCDLCLKLNDRGFREQSHTYSDVNSWWNGVCTNYSKIRF